MTPKAPAPSRTAVVAALRSAGCVFAEAEAELLIAAAGEQADLAAMVERRADGLPLEHVLGWAEFCGLRITVDPGVFVPRRRTEFLARQAIALAGQRVLAVDLCCGSGAVGAALLASVREAEVYAADIDPVAVRCARRNLPAGRVFDGDLYAPLPPSLGGRVEILVANAPYVPTGEIGFLPSEARVHEHRVALDGGTDGLDIQRRVIAGAGRWLVPGGHLLIEASARQAPQTAEACVRAGLSARVTGDAALDATVVIGTRLRAVGVQSGDRSTTTRRRR